MPHIQKSDCAAIIVAAGRGIRFHNQTKKQFVILCGHPILVWSAWAFSKSVFRDNIVIVADKDDITEIRGRMFDGYEFAKLFRFVVGGASRQESVFNGLQSLKDDVKLVAIHDGVRPAVTHELIDCACKEASVHGAIVTATPAVDSTFIGNECVVSDYVERSTLWQAQTPQIFKIDEIIQAHNSAQKDNVSASDDAFLYRNYVGTVRVVQGDMTNIKVTYRHDLKAVEEILKARGQCPK